VRRCVFEHRFFSGSRHGARESDALHIMPSHAWTPDADALDSVEIDTNLGHPSDPVGLVSVGSRGCVTKSQAVARFQITAASTPWSKLDRHGPTRMSRAGIQFTAAAVETIEYAAGGLHQAGEQIIVEKSLPIENKEEPTAADKAQASTARGTLWEQLERQRAELEEVAKERADPKRRVQRGLDEDEAAFLDEHTQRSRERERELLELQNQDKLAFEMARTAAKAGVGAPLSAGPAAVVAAPVVRAPKVAPLVPRLARRPLAAVSDSGASALSTASSAGGGSTNASCNMGGDADGNDSSRGPPAAKRARLQETADAGESAGCARDATSERVGSTHLETGLGGLARLPACSSATAASLGATGKRADSAAPTAAAAGGSAALPSSDKPTEPAKPPRGLVAYGSDDEDDDGGR